jgi:YrbI family 3-deoxy-D-manno-octulosonate 8-phosphate phosphatase
MKFLAIIPARGGSKGIPGKNLKPVGGVPLIVHTIRAARGSRHVGRVIVSTDSPEIAAAAQANGAEAVARPGEISGDRASSEAALLHVLAELHRTEGTQPDYLVFLQCTSPLTTAADIDGTIDELLARGADTALAVAPAHHFLWRHDAAGNAVGVNHDKNVRLLRQQRHPEFIETGAVYVLHTAGFLAARHRFFGQTAFHVTPRSRCMEIDEPDDLFMAEALLLQARQATASAALPVTPAALVFDFDGVFTDNRVIVFEDGREAVQCDRGDGWGLACARRLNLPMAVFSTEKNPVVAARCRKLDLECHQGLSHKWTALQAWMAAHRFDPARVVYVGNDTNDLECMAGVGCPVAVADACSAVKAAAKIVLAAPGGHGAVRELLELLEARLAAHTHP